MRPMLAKEAQALLYNYMQRLFKGRLDSLMTIKPDTAFTEKAIQAIIDLADNNDKGIEELPVAVQRYMYEILSHGLALLMYLEEDRPVPEMIEDSMSDAEKLSVLLKNGIPGMIGLIPKSH